MEQIFGHQLDGLRSINFDQLTVLTIIIDQRRGLLQVHIDPALDGLGPIIVSLVQFRSVDIALASFLRRIELRVENMTVCTTGRLWR